mmetsp:Transcript_3941/g.12315  ORF Transcript_3941/g.12315 Transcript_3941/m.12315 type:complete len:206 (+) Transcript_3941:610-1227(+)
MASRHRNLSSLIRSRTPLAASSTLSVPGSLTAAPAFGATRPAGGSTAAMNVSATDPTVVVVQPHARKMSRKMVTSSLKFSSASLQKSAAAHECSHLSPLPSRVYTIRCISSQTMDAIWRKYATLSTITSRCTVLPALSTCRHATAPSHAATLAMASSTALCTQNRPSSSAGRWPPAFRKVSFTLSGGRLRASYHSSWQSEMMTYQ